MPKKPDPFAGLDRATEQAAGLKKQGLGAFKPKRESKETKVAAYRIGEELIARIDQAAAEQGVDSRRKGAFVALLLTYALDALDRGALALPMRPRAAV